VSGAPACAAFPRAVTRTHITPRSSVTSRLRVCAATISVVGRTAPASRRYASPSGPRFSSSPTNVKAISPVPGPPRRAISPASHRWTAIELLQLHAPSPYTRPSFGVATSGSVDHAVRSPMPTVSA